MGVLMEDTNFYSEEDIEVTETVPEDSSVSVEGTSEDIQNEISEVQEDVIINGNTYNSFTLIYFIISTSISISYKIIP